MEVQGFLKEQEQKIEALYKKLQFSYWNAAISGKEQAYKEYELASLEFKKFFNDKNNFQKVKEFLKTSKEELQKRQLKLLYDSYLSCQGELPILAELTKKATEVEKHSIPTGQK